MNNYVKINFLHSQVLAPGDGKKKDDRKGRWDALQGHPIKTTLNFRPLER